ncbi:hypothetical protein ECANGB1_1576 [Enterospora canceri]|uniref:C2H2-type domain-containing protein n=1 Tax=Enterospora canceri TaxID=1081671 RepID=A0A1Y1S5Q8_9MICR|nr:hypothetical protein ECANGB1_1576 [Enterospora canceri]
MLFCTSCNRTIEDTEHYKTEMHVLNSMRKCRGEEPIAYADCESCSSSDEVSLRGSDSGEFESLSRRGLDIHAGITVNLANERATCIFCPETGTPVHYHKMHGLDSEQISFVFSGICFICKDGFVTQGELVRHMEQNRHRNVLTDGVSLYLENGKILHQDKMKMTNCHGFGSQGFRRS